MNITGDNSLYNIPFDQYQRYKTASLIIENYRTDRKNVSILEIGANEHKNLEKFLPKDKIKYLDIQLPDYLQKDQNYILANATNMPQVEDNSFDIVIALDVFEHIPQNLREKFLAELNRVAKEFVILAGPFDEQYVSETEKNVNEYYKKKYDEDYIWLKEHIENKLPDLNDTINYLQNDLGCKVNSFSHGSLEIWEKLMSFYLTISDNSSLYEYKRMINYIYNRTFYKFDVAENSYRTFLTYSKSNFNIVPRIESNSNKLETFKSLLDQLPLLVNYEINLPNSQLQIEELWKRVNESEAKLEQSEQNNQELWKRINQCESELEEINSLNFIKYVRNFFKK